MEKEQKSGFSIVGIIIVIAAVAILGGGFLYWGGIWNELFPKPSFVPYVEPRDFQEEQKWLHKADQIDTSQWETYRNEKYGFEVRYPPSAIAFLNIFDLAGEAKNLYFCPGRGSGLYMFLTDAEFRKGVELVRGEGFCHAISFEEYIKKYIGNSNFISMQKLKTLDGIPVYFVNFIGEVSTSPDSGKVSRISRYVVFVEYTRIQDTRSLEFFLRDKEHRSMVGQIFSTFKFIK